MNSLSAVMKKGLVLEMTRMGTTHVSALLLRKWKMMPTCPDCGVPVGELHVPGCDVEQCPHCGLQLLTCAWGNAGLDFEATKSSARLPWSGWVTGEAECAEFGWCVRGGAQGWERCSPDHPNAFPNLSRLYSEAVWCPKTKRWYRPSDERRSVPSTPVPEEGADRLVTICAQCQCAFLDQGTADAAWRDLPLHLQPGRLCDSCVWEAVGI